MKPPRVQPVKLTFHRARPQGVTVDGAIVHEMAEYVLNEGQQEHGPALLQRLGLSVHAFIGPDGTIYQGPGMDRVCFHAGKSKFLDRENLNDSFLGCEFLVAGTHDYASLVKRMDDTEDPPYTAAQYDAGGWLYATWAAAFPGITRARIIGHSTVSGKDVRPHDPKRDPGLAFDWAAFLRAFDAWTAAMRQEVAP